MKISYNWLQQYISTNKSITDITDILTQTGLEVENIETVEAVKGGLDGLVVGEIVEKEKHPNADNLSITKVNIGHDELLPIVCGAPNVAIGQKIILATVGAILHPSSGESFKIKKGKIRGEVSLGMICAEDEIGLGEGHDGIIVLENYAKVGQSAASYFNLENDTCIEIGLTPNRTDGMSHLGVARDLASALCNMEGIINELNSKATFPSVEAFAIDNNDLKIDVKVNDYEACPRYCGLTISNIKIESSPEWLQKRLKTIGINPTNNVVDITNYVLHELGQPLHAFDTEKITDNKIIVGHPRAKQKFLCLDEQERELHIEDLMINNSKNPMCIAGVFGGMDSGVTNETKSIFLESAYFNPVSVRKTAKRHGLNTDASFRFERGADPNITIYALKRAALLIKEICGGEISSEITDIYPDPIFHFPITVKLDNVKRLLGFEIPKNNIISILLSLDIEITKEEEGYLYVAVPPYRADVKREADIIEEIIRIYGFNNVPLPEKLNSSLSFSSKPNKEKVMNITADLLAAKGFLEIMSNSLTKEKYTEDLVVAHINKDENVKMLNPLSSDLGVMRQTLIYGGLEAVSRNKNHKNHNLRFFEFGKEYRLKGESKYNEESHLMIMMTGDQEKESWNKPDNAISFSDLKGTVEDILHRIGIYKNVTEVDSILEILDSGIALTINRKNIVQLGWIKESFLNYFSVKSPVLVADINWDNIIELLIMNKTKFKSITKFPVVRRDLSLLLDEKITFGQIKSITQKTEKKLLQSINLFDVYEGKNLEKGKKSYAISFTFSDSEKTMTDKQIEKIMGKIQSSLEQQLGASLR